MKEKLIKECVNAIPIYVRFIKSIYLKLQCVICKLFSLLSQNDECLRAIRIHGLEGLCTALNTCSNSATLYIVPTLARMPIEIKDVMVNIIGENGIDALITFLKQSDNLSLQRDTAILLAILAGNCKSLIFVFCYKVKIILYYCLC